MSQFIEMFGSPDKTKQLSDFIEASFPGEWGEEDKDGTGVKVIRTTNFTNEGKLNLADVVTRKIDSSKVEKKKLRKGDIILERSGGTNENPVGRVVYYDVDGTYLFNNFTQLLRCKDEVCPLFIFYSLYNYYQTNKSVIRSMGNKTTGIQNLKMDNYWKIPIADVSYESQNSFATIYKQADKSEFDGFKSQFIEMFKDETNTVALQDVVTVKDECRKPINDGVRSKMKEGTLYPYYGATGVVDYINDYITDEQLLCIAEDCGNYKAGEDSSYIIQGKAWVNNHAHIVKPKDICDIKYLHILLKLKNLMPFVSGTTRLKLTQKKLKEIPILLPSKDKQMQFVAIAEQADKSEYVGCYSITKPKAIC